MLNITPYVEVLVALRRQSLQWKTLIAELIDNSVDADASQIEIFLGPGKKLRITDDGKGCKDIAEMLRLGGRVSHSSTRPSLGRYGIGLKDAALYLWGITEISTIHKNSGQRVAVDWGKIEASGKWEAPDPEFYDPEGKTGTTVSFSKIQKNLPNLENLRDDLGYIFSPALLSGKQIVLVTNGKRRPCIAYRLPPLTDVIDSEFEVDGKQVHLTAGIVLEGHKNKHSGFTYQHGHRVIETSALGSKGFSVSRVAGIVDLVGSSWTLSKNKDSLVEFRDELEKAIFFHCEDMLRKADIQSSSLESAALTTEIKNLMSDALENVAAQKKEKRNPTHNKQGTVLPKNTGIRRRRASQIHDIKGSIEQGAGSRINFEWSESLGEKMGEADLNGSRVKLNAEKDYLKKLRRENNADALAIIAFGIYVDSVVASDGKQLKLKFDGKFIDAWGEVLDGMPSETKLLAKVG